MQRLLNEFVTLFAVLDPFSTLPVFLALTHGMTAVEARRLAVRAVIVSGAVLLFFVIAGQALLRALGIPLSSFQLAGSVVLFLFGLKMIFGELHPATGGVAPEAGHDPAVFPLAIPSIAGPGAILTVVLLTDHTRHGFGEQLETLVEIAVLLSITLLFLIAARRIVRIVGASGISVIARVMGLLLVSLAVHGGVLAVSSLQFVSKAP
jgi:multiple antibiotic resistance protein